MFSVAKCEQQRALAIIVVTMQEVIIAGLLPRGSLNTAVTCYHKVMRRADRAVAS